MHYNTAFRQSSHDYLLQGRLVSLMSEEAVSDNKKHITQQPHLYVMLYDQTDQTQPPYSPHTFCIVNEHCNEGVVAAGLRVTAQ